MKNIPAEQDGGGGPGRALSISCGTGRGQPTTLQLWHNRAEMAMGSMVSRGALRDLGFEESGVLRDLQYEVERGECGGVVRRQVPCII